ncbi:MAG: FkbM family methyltransferase [Bacteroidia bacterium]|nr:FkbM family methyltransferase [Bacteroidia bacterium]MDW8134271.1 FkbM family methyltransferase [Bacteroidia bacterium]
MIWRGYTLSDTLALLTNRVFSAGFTALLALWKGSLREARKARDREYQQYGVTHFPFLLERRMYYVPRARVWLDGQAWNWRLDFPTEWLEAIKPGSIGLDVGGHRGYFALTVGRRVMPGGLIVALEPSPYNFLYFLRNISFNSAEWVIPLRAAAWKHATRLALHPLYPWGAFYSYSFSPYESERGEILGVSLDEVFRFFQLPRVDWMKVDVEGVELEVLQGAKHILSYCKPHIWMGIHHSMAKVKEALQSLGYTIKALHNESDSGGSLWAVPIRSV